MRCEARKRKARRLAVADNRVPEARMGRIWLSIRRFWRSSQSYVDNLANRRDADDIRHGLRHVGTGTSPPKTFTSSTL